MKGRPRRGPLIAVLVIGLALALAPAVFGMFSRAPDGGVMIDEFRPYMTEAEISSFRGYLDLIDAADAEALELRAALVASGALDPEDEATTLGGVVALNEQWGGIDADMGDLLDRMDANRDNYEAVDALPDFALFPWFFVVPGLLVAGVAASVLWSWHRGRTARTRVLVLVGLGTAIALAPVVFSMFTRAPLGGSMIDDFRPMMTTERVRNVQGYFVVMGGAEGQLRTAALPLLAESGGDPADFPALAQFSEDWPGIVGDFNPMVATMSDNVDNFAGVDAMPPFALFPWFFLIPGLLVAVLALVSREPRTAAEPTAPTGLDDEASEQGAIP